ncbi:unnamed protein product [Fraxinus pennsylvanica]|uniref:Gnk2-homologous domain-containing protein n=1 Tax=Fraxinus pennsylvanica TaxID=56036 RepID=A0AAD1YZS9_9LAMI|nr:unnamed protein product [Fraxinus pennsylvanica]
MNETSLQAANKFSGKKFATKDADFTESVKLYTLAQCTPDLSSKDCDFCLQNANSRLPTCCEYKKGGRVISPSCNIRYEIYPFYNATTVPAPAPAPAPAPVLAPAPAPNNKQGNRGISRQVIIAIVVPIVVVSLVVLLVGLRFLIGRTMKKKQYRTIKQRNEEDEISIVESLQYELITIELATTSFSADNKIGEGGFGDVYKGIFPDGREIAVKRLSRSSAQEYAIHGQFSIKSDVFSFGVLILEIISGKKSNGFYKSHGTRDLISYAWKLWRNGAPLELMDPILQESFVLDEVIRCIRIGLLCVEEDVTKRPTMSSILPMLESYSDTLPIPRRPAFFIPNGSDSMTKEIDPNQPQSINEASIRRIEDTSRAFYSGQLGGATAGDSGVPDRPKVHGFVGIQTGFSSGDRRKALRSTWFPSDPENLLRIFSDQNGNEEIITKGASVVHGEPAQDENCPPKVHSDVAVLHEKLTKQVIKEGHEFGVSQNQVSSNKKELKPESEKMKATNNKELKPESEKMNVLPSLSIDVLQEIGKRCRSNVYVTSKKQCQIAFILFQVHHNVSSCSDEGNEILTAEPLQYDLNNIQLATNNFSHDNKLVKAWRLERNSTPLELMDPTLQESYVLDEVIQCFQIGLLCVPENVDRRPRMASVLAMLAYSNALPLPHRLAFCFSNRSDCTTKKLDPNQLMSINEASISEMCLR